MLGDKNEDIKQLIEKLIIDLKSSNTEIRRNAATTFWNYSTSSSYEENRNEKNDKLSEFNHITREIAFDSIVLGLKDEDRLVRLGLVFCLGRLNDPRAVDPLINALSHEDSGFREACSRQLLSLKEFSYHPLIEALKSNDKNVRRMAISCLGEINNPNTYDYYVEALKDPDWNVRFKAIESIGKLGDEKALEPLTNSLDDKSANVRRKATEVIGLLSVGEKLLTGKEKAEESKRLAEEQNNLIGL